jgi:hypothetical protein
MSDTPTDANSTPQPADALHAGQFVVVVLAPNEERKTLAARMIQQHGGKFINFLGEWMIERMGRARPL